MSAHVKTLADLALELQTPLSLDDMLQRLVERDRGRPRPRGDRRLTCTGDTP